MAFNHSHRVAKALLKKATQVASKLEAAGNGFIMRGRSTFIQISKDSVKDIVDAVEKEAGVAPLPATRKANF